MANKSIWECCITVHSSIKEKTNSVLLALAKEKGGQKSKIMQELIESHPEYEKKKKEMEEDGFFV